MTTTIASQERYDLGGVGDTALWMAAYRARESRRPDRLYNDPFAELLAGTKGPKLLTHFHTAHASDEGNPYLAIRTRWFDDFITDNVTPGSQAVGLGAGLDCRAYRKDWPADITLFEVDQPAVLAYKAEKLESIGAQRRCDTRTVPVNLGDDWMSALAEAGHDPARPTTWFSEGVLFYLPMELAKTVLRSAARLSAPGSRIAMDLVGTGIFSFPYTQEFLSRLKAADSPWQWGTDDLRGLLESCGWTDVTVVEPGNESASYGRWPEAAAPSNIPSIPRIYLVSATVAS
ncbi:SAM-dependent methyltransferase [Solwaraspora sp. WMMD406]|uniref:SAM-dependent methyltransferase n=1 Tax=Solwaraspora sp. WMMD406 TaxID=3016095 RepID=UPI002416ED40|nr:SAM-dependent methyltransferase [Solwaraspora sp. WMMD406]MDG4766921.1 SAM-dependent methyltransferase [Solwaraspora sp. WMMD406]